ncbi:MAG: hypothetical protein KatS3mg027_2538 [Bacteroidia bacterium]|nr:MAG: hypothetical protein KatS3mg027_2538 [Bacteroidia bacterium]
MKLKLPKLNIIKFLKKIQGDKRTWLAILAVVILSLAASFYFFMKQSPEAGAGWWNEDWHYRKKLTIDATKIDADLTDFPVAVILTTSNFTYANAQSAGQDIRFTDANGNTLYHEIEKWNSSATSTIWVKVPQVDDTIDTIIYMYYGNASVADGQNKTAVWDDGYVAVYHLHEDQYNPSNGPGYHMDSTKFRHYVNLNWLGESGNGTTTADGILDGADEFKGIGRLTGPDSYELSGMENLTLEAWVRNDVRPTDQSESIVSKQAWSYDFSLQTSGKLFFTYYNQNNSWRGLSGNGVLATSTWYHVAAQYDGNYRRIFINGELDVENNLSGDTITRSSGNFDIGGWQYWDGIIDEVRVSKWARSSAWLKASYESGRNNLITFATEEKGPGPIAYWAFDEGYGTTTSDLANANHGTIYGATWKESNECIKGKCLYFDGSGDYVTSINNIGITGNSPRTVSIWFKQDISEEKNIFGFGGNAPAQLFDILLDNGSTLVGHFYSAGNDTTAGAPSYKQNEWNQAVLTYDGTKVDVYLNGIYRNSKTIDLNTSSSQVIIGGGKYAVYNYFQGYIDEVKVYNYARSADQIKNDYNKGLNISLGQSDPYASLSDGLVGWWKMDELSSATNFVDSSGNNNTLTSFSNASTTAGKYGNSGIFDGVDDYMYISNDSDFRIWGPISIALWVKPENITTEWTRFVDKNYSSGYSFTTGSSGSYDDLSFWHNNQEIIDTGPVLKLNQWQHVAVTYDGKIAKIFLNGELVDSKPYNGVASGNTSALYIGGTPTYPRDLDGQLDDVRIYNRGLSDDEIRRLYEWAPGPVAYWRFDEGSGQDVFSSVVSSTDNYWIKGYLGSSTNVESNDPIWVTGKYGSALEFDAANTEQAYIPDPGANSIYDFTTNDSISLALWIKPYVYSNNGGFICKGSANNENWGIEWEGSGPYNRPQFFFRRDNETGWSLYRANQTIPLNKWSHIAVSYTFGSSTSIKMYVNGVLTTGSWVNGTGAEIPDNDDTGIYIGRNPWAGEEFTGSIDDVKLYKYIRNTRQIREDMHAGRKNNPIGYWSFDEAGGQQVNDYSGMENVMTLGATTATSTDDPSRISHGRFNSALSFDGSDDYAKASGEITAYNFGSNDFSVSFYTKFTDAKNYGSLVGQGYLDNEIGWGFYYNSTGQITFQTRNLTNISDVVSDNSLNDGNWHHIVGKRENGVLRMYVDGELQNDVDNVVRDLSGSGEVFAIGARSSTNGASFGYNAEATIDEVKVYNYALTLDEIRQNYNVGQQIVLSSSATDNQTEGLLLWWKMDEASWNGTAGEVKDSSGNGNHGVRVNDANTTSTAKFGRAANLDGDSDRVHITTNGTNLDNIETSDFTMSVWLKTSTTTKSFADITYADGSQYFMHLVNDQSIVRAYFYLNGTDYKALESDSGSISVGQWYHLAVTRNYKSGETIMYLNGVEVDRLQAVGTTGYSPTVFGLGNGSSYCFQGQLDDLKVYNIVRSPDQIAQDYADGPPPTGYWKLDDLSSATAVDSSGNGNNGTLTGGPIWKEKGKVGGAAWFDGSDDHILLNNHTALQNFSLSMWFNIESSPGGSSAVLAGGYTGYGGSLIKIDSATNIRFRTEGDYTSDFTVPTILQNTWYHLVVTRENSNTRVYLNGKESTSGIKTNIGDFVFKKISGYQAGQYFNGTIDEVKLFDYALTPRQVRQVYDGGRPIAYWKMDEGETTVLIKDYSGNGIDASCSGSNCPTATSSGFINGYRYFDGLNSGNYDYLSVPNTLSHPGYNNISFSFWFFISDNSTEDVSPFNQDYLFNWYMSDPNAYIVAKVDAANYPQFYMRDINGNNLGWVTSNKPVQLDTWYHLAVVRINQSTANLYLNGELVASGTNASLGDISGPGTCGLMIGIYYTASSCGPTWHSWMKGGIDEFKIYNYALTPAEIKQEYNGGFSSFFR